MMEENRRNRVWERIAVGLLLLLTSFLHFWNLAQNGWGNPYYAAAVRSMRTSFHHFTFAAYDPAGFISVDKPPLALWIQTVSTFLLGYNGLALILPEALAGVLSVLLLYRIVRRYFGPLASVMAGLFLVLTPICVAVDRINLPDSLVTLVLLGAAGNLLLAVETGNTRHLLLAALLLGAGFNIKMWQALVLLPAFGTVFLCYATQDRQRKLLLSLLSLIVVLSTSFAWVFFVDTVPPDDRPYVGGSQHNSALELVFVYNGWERIAGGKDQLTPQMLEPGAPLATLGSASGFSAGKPGIFRLVNRHLGPQIMWWGWLALVGGVVAVRQMKNLAREQHAAIGLWGGWFSTFALLFSFAGGTIHVYYVSILAPSIAALAGVGVSFLWRSRHGWVLAAVILFAALWQVFLLRSSLSQYPTFWIGPLVALVMAPAMLWRPTWSIFASAGLLGLCLCPFCWSWTAVSVPQNGLVPSAGPETAAGGWQFPPPEMPPEFTRRLTDFLIRQQRGERYLLATGSVYNASPIIIQTGKPVMAMGGFLGSDPVLTPDRLAALVKRGEVRFILVSSSDGLPGNTYLAPLFDWTRDHCQAVDPALWMQYQPNYGMEYMTLYDCRQ